MSRYFIDHIQTYSCVNAKGKELQKFVYERFNHCLVADDKSLEQIAKEIQNEMSELQLKYPRTKPFVFNQYKGHFSVKPENKYNDNAVFILSFEKVKSTYLYPNAAGIAQMMFFKELDEDE